MPADPNARRDQKLEGIHSELKKTNRLLEAQNKILEKMERHGRPAPIGRHPYLERTDGEALGDRPGSTAEESGGRALEDVQGRDSDSSR